MATKRRKDEGMFEPIQQQPFQNVRVEPDRNSLYAFFGDVTLYLFIAVAVYLCIDRFIAGQKAFQQFQLLMIAIGLLTIILIIVDRNRAKLVYIFEVFRANKLKLIIAGVNIAIMLAVVILGWTGKTSWSHIKDTIITATWEQLIFSITIPYFLVRTIIFVFKWQNFKIIASLPATVLSGILFGIIHIYAYSGDWSTVGYLILMGIGLHSVGYYLPSLSISIHVMINIFAVGLS